MSLAVTLVGVLAGAGVNGAAQLGFLRRDKAADRRSACLAIDEELLYTRSALQDARNKGEATEATAAVLSVLSVVSGAGGWERHRVLLARRLPTADWDRVLKVYSRLSLLKLRLRSADWYDELNDLIDAVDAARSALARHIRRGGGRGRRPWHRSTRSRARWSAAP